MDVTDAMVDAAAEALLTDFYRRAKGAVPFSLTVPAYMRDRARAALEAAAKVAPA